jgi:hypothetical protein
VAGAAALAIEVPARESILLEADLIVNGTRNQDYGDSNENLRRIAAIATAMGTEISPKGVAVILIAVKLGRHMHRPKRDNLVDAAGYLELLARVEDL